MSLATVMAGAGTGFLVGGPIGMVVGAVAGGLLGGASAPVLVDPTAPQAAQSAASSADLVNAIVAAAPAPTIPGNSTATPSLMQQLIGTPAPTPSQVQLVDASGNVVAVQPAPAAAPIVTSDPATAAAAAAGAVQQAAPAWKPPVSVRGGAQPIAVRPVGVVRPVSPIERNTYVNGYGQFSDMGAGSMWLLTVGLGTVAWMMYRSHKESRA